mmetsp:Transcript_48861/g.146043  ORF Transcript_48861/g.146043 Transcript_48861/m.146043 type:complete len:210 (-) Transcript_48861:8-637(-)
MAPQLMVLLHFMLQRRPATWTSCACSVKRAPTRRSRSATVPRRSSWRRRRATLRSSGCSARGARRWIVAGSMAPRRCSSPRSTTAWRWCASSAGRGRTPPGACRTGLRLFMQRCSMAMRSLLTSWRVSPPRAPSGQQANLGASWAASSALTGRHGWTSCATSWTREGSCDSSRPCTRPHHCSHACGCTSSGFSERLQDPATDSRTSEGD